MTSFWIVAVPSPRGQNPEHARLSRATESRNISHNFKFKIPQDLRVGTLDSLMSLSDELAKMDVTVESFVKKIEKTYEDLASIDIRGVKKFPSDLYIDGKIPALYLQDFRWEQKKYALNTSLKTVAHLIAEQAGGVNKSLGDRLTKLNETRNLLQVIERRESGSLMMRSLTSIINKEDMINREYITSLPIVVPITRQQEFESCYETIENEKTEEDLDREIKKLKTRESARLEEMAKIEEKAIGLELDISDLAPLKPLKAPVKCASVVPGSAKMLYKDDEFCLYRVIVLKKGVDSYSSICRNHRFNVRLYDPKEISESKETEDLERHKLETDVRKIHLSLLRWCQPQYSDLFIGWIHLKAIRTFVEAVLRFGLPVNFIAQFIQPTKGKEKVLRKTLSDLYNHLSGGNKTSTISGNSTEIDFTGLGGEFYPYVYLPVNLGFK